MRVRGDSWEEEKIRLWEELTGYLGVVIPKGRIVILGNLNIKVRGDPSSRNSRN